MPPVSHSEYDVVIAGGGMVGVSLACALASADASLKLLLVDNFPLPKGDGPPTYHPSFDARATALSSASIEIYQRLGVLPQLQQHAAAIHRIHVSDQGHGGSTLMSAEEQGLDNFGYVVENHWLGAVLLNRLRQFDNIELLTGAPVVGIRPQRDCARVTIDTTKLEQYSAESIEASAQLLVVADGAQSGLRDALGIDAEVRNYQQAAIIANLQTQLPHEGCAFERFTPDGAVALLPLPDLAGARHRSALVWTLPLGNPLLDSLDDASAEPARIAALQAAFGQRLGKIERLGKCQAYPLALTVAAESVRNHIVLMGNAAHSLHPIAGQGFNLALRDVAALVHGVARAAQRGESIGDLAVLEQYQAAQAQDQELTIGFSDNLVRWFGEAPLPVLAGRSAGLLALDLIAPLKHGFARQAAGLGGRRYFL